MESDAAPEQQLRAIERPEAVVWVDHPPTACRHPVLMGLWGAATYQRHRAALRALLS